MRGVIITCIHCIINPHMLSWCEIYVLNALEPFPLCNTIKYLVEYSHTSSSWLEPEMTTNLTWFLQAKKSFSNKKRVSLATSSQWFVPPGSVNDRPLIHGSCTTHRNYLWPKRNPLVFRAPADCVQYFTANAGTFTSYNFGGLMLQNQNFATCFRKNEGRLRTLA